MEERSLTEKIIGRAMAVHSTLGPGFLESVYQKALLHELLKSGLQVEAGKSVSVYYDGLVVGDFIADILVQERVLIEIKANTQISTANEAQLVNYLTATRIDVGLLLNFGAPRLEVKRKVRILKRQAPSEDATL